MAGVTGSAAEVARYLERAARKLPAAGGAATGMAAKLAAGYARKLSQGAYSQKQLTAMGHPYAKRDPQPPQDPAIINRQTGGAFADSWLVDGPVSYGDGHLAIVTNTSPEAAFVLNEGGTKLMIERPLPERAAQQTEPEAGALTLRAVEKVFP